MKKITKSLLIALLAAMIAAAMFVFASCGTKPHSADTDSGEPTSVSDSTDPTGSDSTGESVSDDTPVHVHVYEDDFTCHDRQCLNCDHVEPASTEHRLGEYVTVRPATCTEKGFERATCLDCEEEVERDIEPTGHTYADDFTCHDRQCLNCDYVEKATTSHNYGEWEVVSEATCLKDGENKRTCLDCGYVKTKTVVVGHKFDEQGVCETCQKSYKDLFIKADDYVNVAFDNAEGTYSITTVEDSNAYFTIPASIMTELKALGYEKLTVTITNPAPGLADAANKCKAAFFAADSTSNLWSADTAIAYWDWKPFWDNGKSATFEIDVDEYAGKDIYAYTTHTDAYPLIVRIGEFVEYENKSVWLQSSSNSQVNYFEGKGWIVSSVDGASDFYAKISVDVVNYYMSKGYVAIKVVYSNNLGVEGYANEGNFVNTQTRPLPEKIEGGNDWLYRASFISQHAKVDPITGAFFDVIDLTDEAHDFSKEIEYYFPKGDVVSNLITNAYFSDISFMKAEDHAFDKNGVCALCGKSYKESLIAPNGSETVAVNATEGRYEITNTESGAYAKVSGEVLAIAKALGYTELNINVTNPATLPVATEKCKGFFLATANDNLWSADTAIAYYDWKTFWDAGRRVSFKLDLEAYAGTDLVIYTDKCDGYATVITVSEFIDGIAKTSWIKNGDNATVEYLDGKGWVVANTDASKAGNAYLSTEVIQWNVFNGYTKMRFWLADDIGAEGKENVTAFTASDFRIMPTKAGGGDDWDLANPNTGFIQKYATKDGATGRWYYDVDLSDASHVYTNDVRLYFGGSAGKTPYGFISDIEFIKITAPAKDNYLLAGDNGKVTYVDGKGWIVSSVDGSGDFYATVSADVISYYVAEGRTLLRITYANNLHVEGYENEGNFVNTQSRIIPVKAAGGNEWSYSTGFISGYAARNENDSNLYTFYIDLADATYNFNGGIRYYFQKTDVASKSITNAYFADIAFILPHVYGEWNTVEQETCGKDGLKERYCTDCGLKQTEAIPATGEHTYGEWTVDTEATCGKDGLQKKVCSVCGHEETEVIAATGEHTYGEWITVNEAVCGTDGLKKKVCSVCGHEETEVIAATGEHTYGEWTTETEPSCNAFGSKKRTCTNCNAEQIAEINRTDAHTFDENGVCSVCGKTYLELFAVAVGKEDGVTGPGTVTNPSAGLYSITNDSNKSVFRIPASVLTYYKNSGYTSVDIVVFYDSTDENNKKNIYIASSLEDIENKDKYIYYKSGKNFWSQGKKYAFSIDLEKYASTGIYVQTNKSDLYPTYIKLVEEYAKAEENWLEKSDNGTVTYVEGKGWIVSAVDAAADHYATISGEAIGYYTAKGYTSLKITYANNLHVEGYENEGNFVNTQSRIIPVKAAGGSEWSYSSGFISGYATRDENDSNLYSFTIDLTDATYNFADGIRFYFQKGDVGGKSVPNSYIAGMEFIKAE